MLIPHRAYTHITHSICKAPADVNTDIHQQRWLSAQGPIYRKRCWTQAVWHMGAQCRQERVYQSAHVCVCVYCMWASVALWLEVDRPLCLFNLIRGCHPLGSAHSGFQKGNSIYCLHATHTSSSERSQALWKHPFICSVIWGDFKARSGYVIVAYLERCVPKGFFFFFSLRSEDKMKNSCSLQKYILMNRCFIYLFLFLRESSRSHFAAQNTKRERGRCLILLLSTWEDL